MVVLFSYLFRVSLLFICIVQRSSCGAVVKYVLGLPAENCRYTCGDLQMSCIAKNAFPLNNSLSIFHSLNVNCKTDSSTDKYRYPDQPNYIIFGGWKDRCTGFLARSHKHTHCDVGGNPTVIRLCPCTNTTSPVTPSLPTNVTTAQYNATSTQSAPATTAQTATSTTTRTTTYVLGSPGENCIYACGALQMSCIAKNAFPLPNSLSIFHSLNVNCTTDSSTDKYTYFDQPNYIVSPDHAWNGRCTGFLARKHKHTLCEVGGNPIVRRLCPCTNITSPLSPPLPTTAQYNRSTTKQSAPITTAASTTIPTTSPTTLFLSSKAPENITLTRKTTQDYYTTLLLDEWKIIVISFVIILVIALTAAGVIFAYKRKNKGYIYSRYNGSKIIELSRLTEN